MIIGLARKHETIVGSIQGVEDSDPLLDIQFKGTPLESKGQQTAAATTAPSSQLPQFP